MEVKKGYIYLLTTASNNAIYTSVTSNPQKRIPQHKNKFFPNCFTAKYNCTKLVYIGEFASIEAAIAEEKRLKGGGRNQKINLINDQNPTWRELWDEVTRYS